MDDRKFIQQWRQLWRLMAPPHCLMRVNIERSMVAQPTDPTVEAKGKIGASTNHVGACTAVRVPRVH